MKKLLLLVLLLASLTIAACSGADSNDTAAQIIGTWQGVIEGDGNAFPSEWEFAGNGKLTVIIAPGTLNVVQVADYWFDDDGALRIKDVDADEGVDPGRRVVDFVTDNTITLTAEQADEVITLRRVVND